MLLRPLPPDEEDVEVGWHLHPAVWGRGYATEIGRAAAKRAFETGIDEVFAIVRPGNERSSQVARRLGMSYVGRTDKYWGLHAELFRLRPAGSDRPDGVQPVRDAVGAATALPALRYQRSPPPWI